MSKIEYRRQIKLIRERIVNRDYEDLIRMREAGIGTEGYVVNTRMLTAEEAYEMYKKVIYLAEHPELEINAVGMLIDRDLYESLDGAARERYVLSLAAIYKTMRAHYECRSQFGPLQKVR